MENGFRHLQSSLKDALGNVRVKILANMARTKYGVVESLQMARGNPKTGQMMIKDDSRDHTLDALRYLACEMLTPRQQSPRFVG